MIELTVNRKAYGDAPVISALSLTLRAGELVCLLGPSGCGKTTLLNILAGLDGDYSGILHSSHYRVSYMFQEPRLLPWRTVRQNLALVADIQQQRKIDELLKLMELGDVASQYPGRLSLGMARRVALARTLINDPDLILMDEPFVSLDPPTAASLGEVLKRLRQMRPEVAILMVTHNIREALALSDRILVLGNQPTEVICEYFPKRKGGTVELAEEKKLLAFYQKTEADELIVPKVRELTAIG